MVESYDPLNCVRQLRQALAADKLAIGFFLGAGCPCSIRVPDAGEGADVPLIPDVSGITTLVKMEIEQSAEIAGPFSKITEALSEDGNANPNIEAMLSLIRALRSVAGSSKVRGLTFEHLTKLDQQISRTISGIVERKLPGSSTPYHALALFLANQGAPSEIFTTNYDLLMEQALEAHQVPYFDGFIGSARPFFDQHAIEEDLLPSRWSRLWKLHGSINWRLNTATRTVVRTTDRSDGDELLIHPSHLKYEESRRMPYLIMIDRLRSFIRNRQNPVALFVMGYSFSDDHINEAIAESLRANPSSTCFALQYDSLSTYPKAEELARNNSNLSIFSRDECVIRRQHYIWKAKPETDHALLHGVFNIEDNNGNGNPQSSGKREAETEQESLPCEFILGDFSELGKFLDEFSGYSKPVDAETTREP